MAFIARTILSIGVGIVLAFLLTLALGHALSNDLVFGVIIGGVSVNVLLATLLK